jgi:hypothetical protein
MSISVEDQIFCLKKELLERRRELEGDNIELKTVLRLIWDERGLTTRIWERIADCLEESNEDIPVRTYDPSPVTAIDILKIRQRINVIERHIWGDQANKVIPE